MTAPSISAPLVIYTRCTENDVENDYEGGRIIFTKIAGQTPDVHANVLGCNVVISAANDPFMRQYPVTRDEKQTRFFKVTLEEIALADVPPDPNAPPELFNKAGARVNANGDLVS